MHYSKIPYNPTQFRSLFSALKWSFCLVIVNVDRWWIRSFIYLFSFGQPFIMSGRHVYILSLLYLIAIVSVQFNIHKSNHQLSQYYVHPTNYIMDPTWQAVTSLAVTPRFRLSLTSSSSRVLFFTKSVHWRHLLIPRVVQDIRHINYSSPWNQYTSRPPRRPCSTRRARSSLLCWRDSTKVRLPG